MLKLLTPSAAATTIEANNLAWGANECPRLQCDYAIDYVTWLGHDLQIPLIEGRLRRLS